MSILVLNCGSSSLKFRLVDVETQTARASGLVERIAGVGDHGDALATVLEPLGIRVDEDRNLAASGEARAISPPDAAVAVLVVPTDEELEMAEQAAALVGC